MSRIFAVAALGAVLLTACAAPASPAPTTDTGGAPTVSVFRSPT